MYSRKIAVTVIVIKKKEHSEKYRLTCIMKLPNFPHEYLSLSAKKIIKYLIFKR